LQIKLPYQLILLIKIKLRNFFLSTGELTLTLQMYKKLVAMWTKKFKMIERDTVNEKN